jgi:hypothetical protein
MIKYLFIYAFLISSCSVFKSMSNDTDDGDIVYGNNIKYNTVDYSLVFPDPNKNYTEEEILEKIKSNQMLLDTIIDKMKPINAKFENATKLFKQNKISPKAYKNEINEIDRKKMEIGDPIKIVEANQAFKGKLITNQKLNHTSFFEIEKGFGLLSFYTFNEYGLTLKLSNGMEANVKFLTNEIYCGQTGTVNFKVPAGRYTYYYYGSTSSFSNMHSSVKTIDIKSGECMKILLKD